MLSHGALYVKYWCIFRFFAYRYTQNHKTAARTLQQQKMAREPPQKRQIFISEIQQRSKVSIPIFDQINSNKINTHLSAFFFFCSPCPALLAFLTILAAWWAALYLCTPHPPFHHQPRFWPYSNMPKGHQWKPRNKLLKTQTNR